jgi:hypothetical protein
VIPRERIMKDSRTGTGRNGTYPSRRVRSVIVMQNDIWQLVEDDDGVDIRTLHPGTTVIVETANSRYRFVILLDPSAVLVTGDAMFPDQAIARLVGATIGSTVKVGWILVGLRIEMYFGPIRITSSPVRSVRVETVPPSIWQSSAVR